MDREAFIEACLERARETRKLHWSPGEDRLVSGTKIGGEPWWPRGVDRPRCAADHDMAFVAQIRLRDVPAFEIEADTLLSFHYCDDCALEGNMSFGWPRDRGRGYDLRFLRVEGFEPDGRGVVAEDRVGPQRIELAAVVEVPALDDLPDSVAREAPEDFFRYVAPDHDEYSPIPSDHIYPGLEHVSATKLGGHPSWMQDPDWPAATSGQRMEFVAQLDMSLCRELAWASGIALLFATAADPRAPEAELVIQTS